MAEEALELQEPTKEDVGELLPEEGDVMRQLAETLARQIVGRLQMMTRGKPMQWVGLDAIQAHLEMRDPAVTAAALQYSIDQGWVIVRDRCNICLSSKGRKPVQARRP